jgi:hypothetical protein
MRNRTFFQRIITLACLNSILAVTALADEPVTRAGRIRAAQLKKSASLVPEERTLIDKRISTGAKIFMENLTYGIGGLGVRFGGLPTGQGFALGPQFTRYGLADGRLLLRGSAAGSSIGAYLLDLQVSVPNLASRRAFLDLECAYGNYPRIDYYGKGPDSSRGGRSHFRLEENRYDLLVGLGPFHHLYAGFTGGYLGINVGRGNRTGIAHTEEVFSEAAAPGLQQQTDFLRSGLFVRFDYRDDPIGPRSGGMYLARFNVYNDYHLNRYDFRTLELEARQYIPFFNKRRGFALAGAATLSYPNGTSVVPFYLQPTLGGSNDLRGFRSYRFYDDNMVVFNTEYRWEAFSGLDMALFFDAGKVAPKRSQVNLHNLETSVGFGFRFNARNRTFLRIDTGFSHEGFQVWVKFGAPPSVRTRETAISGKR